jgi:hypothetical protein
MHGFTNIGIDGPALLNGADDRREVVAFILCLASGRRRGAKKGNNWRAAIVPITPSATPVARPRRFSNAIGFSPYPVLRNVTLGRSALSASGAPEAFQK